MQPNNSNTSLPFTQFWHHFSKHAHKQNKAQLKANRISKLKNFNQEEFKEMCDEIDKKRISMKQTKQRPECILRSISVNNKNNRSKGKENQELKHSKRRKRQQISLMKCNSVVVENSRRHHSCLTQQVRSEKKKERISDKILQIIEVNVFPFMKEKLMHLEKCILNEINKMQQKMERQSKQITKLHRENKSLQQAYIHIKDTLVNSSEFKQKRITKRDSEKKFKKQVTILENSEPSIRETTENENNIDRLKSLNSTLEYLTMTVEQTKHSIQLKINKLSEQMEKLWKKNKGIEYKIEAQFAEKVFEMISTYNENFIDLNGRISRIEGEIEEKQKYKRLKTSPHYFLLDFKSQNQQMD